MVDLGFRVDEGSKKLYNTKCLKSNASGVTTASSLMAPMQSRNFAGRCHWNLEREHNWR